MKTTASTHIRSPGWLDSFAVGMSTLCAVHCLLTPIVIVAAPVLAASFWARHDFHLWMVLLVLPMTATAVFLGCRKHKDRAVLIASAAGLSLLIAIAIYEAFFSTPAAQGAQSHCAHCTTTDTPSPFTGAVLANLVGGTLLASVHIRNFWLCRKARCTHGAA